MRQLRILALVHEGLIPSRSCSLEELHQAEWKTEHDVITTLEEQGHAVLPVGVHDELGPLRDALREFQPHIVCMLLEAFNGLCTQDSNVVSYLEAMRTPYTGCNSRGLMLARDKALSKKLLHYHRIPSPRFAVCTRGRRPGRPASLRFPLIVKAMLEDASLGLAQASVVHDEPRLRERVSFLHDCIGTDAIIEEYIEGRELSVGVLGNRRLTAFPVWEMRFDKVPAGFVRIATRLVKGNQAYRRKHGIRTERAADLPEGLEGEIRTLARQAYRCLDLSGYARMDVRCAADGRAYVIEANPNPAIAYGDAFSDAAEGLGISYERLLSRIVSLGLSWHRQRS